MTANKTTIHYYRKNVFGNENIYIKDEETQKTIQQLTGKKTIDDHDIDALKKLGFDFDEVLPPRG